MLGQANNLSMEHVFLIFNSPLQEKNQYCISIIKSPVLLIIVTCIRY